MAANNFRPRNGARWRVAALVLASAVGGVRVAAAVSQPDQLIDGTKLLIKTESGNPANNKLVFLSKDNSFALPSPANDPTQGGAVLRVMDLGGVGGSLSITLHQSRWKPTSDGFQYVGLNGDPCKTVKIKQNKLVKLVCKGSSVTLTLPFGGAAALALEVGSASIRYCATFGGAAVLKNVVKSGGKGLFKGNAAPAPVACLACGDGHLDAGEQCDDGNNQNGDCCSASCHFEAVGSGCTDNNACTLNDQCDGAGTCTGGPTCGDGIVEAGCGEQCEVGNDPACPNRCLPDCTCAVEPNCAGDPSRTLFAGGPATSACHRFDGNQVLCDQAFLVGDGGVTSCWYDSNSDSCSGCGPFNQSEGLCVNACNPPTCVADPSRTVFAGGPESAACQNYGLIAGTASCNVAFHIGQSGVASCYYDANLDECRGCGAENQAEGNCVNTCAACTNDPSRTLFTGGPGTQACHQYDGDQASCEQAFHRDQCGHDVSCFYDNGSCEGCGPTNEANGTCRNTCANGPVTCTNDPSRTIDAGGPETAACHQFDGDYVSCQKAFHHTQCNQATACYYDFGSESCNGCGPTNEDSGACVNTCVAGPVTCPADPTRTVLTGLPGSQGCESFGQFAGTAACSVAFNVGAGGPASCYFDENSGGCQGCGPPNESNGVCRNTCLHGTPSCPDDPSRTIYAGGPQTAACHQFDGNQAACEAAFHTGLCGEASCFFDGGFCYGCGPNNEGNGCVNTCRHPTCNGDVTRTIFAGFPGNTGCHYFDGDKTNCLKAFNLGDGGVASCYYDDANDECKGCGPTNQGNGDCANTCPVCGADHSRTIFAGSNQTQGCSQFNGNQASCQSAFEFDDCGHAVSCFFDSSGDCQSCDANNFGNFACQNTCDSGPPTCTKDPTRTIFAGGPGTEACHQFDGDPVSCDKAFHFGQSGIASCFYDSNNGECNGCGAGNQGNGECLNTCLHGVPACSQDPTRTIFTGGPETAACHQFDTDKAACFTAYHLDSCYNATSCYYDDANSVCNGCGPNNLQNGECLNTCATGPASCPLDVSRVFFGGGPGTQACQQFADEASCLAAFHVGQCGVASCYWNGSCQGCGPTNLFNGDCFNTCQAP